MVNYKCQSQLTKYASANNNNYNYYTEGVFKIGQMLKNKDGEISGSGCAIVVNRGLTTRVKGCVL